jgi:hypothetical protein
VAGGWKTCHVPRRTWPDSRIDVFLEELAPSGMHLDRQPAGELIAGQVRAVATLMRVTEATARTHLGDEIIKDVARRMLFEVAGERPGADLMEPPRTVPLPLALVGITVAALAEAIATGRSVVAQAPNSRQRPSMTMSRQRSLSTAITSLRRPRPGQRCQERPARTRLRPNAPSPGSLLAPARSAADLSRSRQIEPGRVSRPQPRLRPADRGQR